MKAEVSRPVRLFNAVLKLVKFLQCGDEMKQPVYVPFDKVFEQKEHE